MRKEVTEIYITEDGKKFTDESEAKLHEKALGRRKAYRVDYCPDLNETGRTMKSGYLLVDASWGHDEWAEYFLYGKFGNRIALVQGSAPTVSWRFSKVEADEVDHNKIIGSVLK
jgi:hypothetical protein